MLVQYLSSLGTPHPPKVSKLFQYQYISCKQYDTGERLQGYYTAVEYILWKNIKLFPKAATE